jgi:predicted dinucleotide-binding enzyme
MTTAIIGTGGIGSAIARQLASGGEALKLWSADKQSAQRLAAAIGGTAGVAVDNRSALQGTDAVILASRFGGIKQSSRLEVGGDLHDLVVGPAEARSTAARLSRRPRPNQE